MKGNTFVRLFSFVLSLSLLATIGVTAQQRPEPVVYEGIEFPDLPYPSRWIEVNGSKMHYMETGDPAGTPILLLHGNPTWSYLWRNIMPHLEDSGRVIAPDLIGMGLSDKPDIGYTFVEQREYLWGFINAMELEDIVLVVHDWGSGLGFDYARNHQDNVQAIAFMEALLAPLPSTDFLSPENKQFIETIRATDGSGEAMIMGQNFFIEGFVPQAIVRELSEDELNAYRAPYPTPETRLPVFVWPNQIPIEGEPAEVQEIVGAYAEWLPQSDMPKLLLYATPGALIPETAVPQIIETFNNLEAVHIGAGLHFVQEDQPDVIGESIAEWLGRVVFAD